MPDDISFARRVLVDSRELALGQNVISIVLMQCRLQRFAATRSFEDEVLVGAALHEKRCLVLRLSFFAQLRPPAMDGEAAVGQWVALAACRT